MLLYLSARASQSEAILTQYLLQEVKNNTKWARSSSCRVRGFTGKGKVIPPVVTQLISHFCALWGILSFSTLNVDNPVRYKHIYCNYI